MAISGDQWIGARSLGPNN